MTAASEHYGRLADDARHGYTPTDGREEPTRPPASQRAAGTRVQLLRRRLEAANTKADEAMAAYEEWSARLDRANPGRAERRIARRDDHDLIDLAAACTFHTALATRLAVTLTVELLTLVVSR